VDLAKAFLAIRRFQMWCRESEDRCYAIYKEPPIHKINKHQTLTDRSPTNLVKPELTFSKLMWQCKLLIQINQPTLATTSINLGPILIPRWSISISVKDPQWLSQVLKQINLCCWAKMKVLLSPHSIINKYSILRKIPQVLLVNSAWNMNYKHPVI